MPWSHVTGALQHAADLDPRDPAPPFFLGRVEMNRQRWSDAEAYFRKTLGNDPGNIRGVQELGSALYQQGKLDEAADTLTRALEMGPSGNDEVAVLNEIARVEMERGNHDRARTLLDKALALQPSGHEVLANLGLLESLLGNRKESIERLREALRYSPGHPVITRYLQKMETPETP